VKALLIPVDGPPREVDLPGGATRFMRSLKALIGTDCAGRIQVTSRWEAWLDEDGAAAGKQVNQAATLVARRFGFEFSFLGPVVIVGVDKDTAEPVALSPAQAGAILGKIREPSAWRRLCRGGGAASVSERSHSVARALNWTCGLAAGKHAVSPSRCGGSASTPTQISLPTCRNRPVSGVSFSTRSSSPGLAASPAIISNSCCTWTTSRNAPLKCCRASPPSGGAHPDSPASRNRDISHRTCGSTQLCAGIY
jgi:hypothetical protein